MNSVVWDLATSPSFSQLDSDSFDTLFGGCSSVCGAHFPRRKKRKMKDVNPYQVLQVRHDATPSEIREAYRRLALWHHPGRSCGSAEERERRVRLFNILAACYETLLDNGTRQKYNRLAHEEAELTGHSFWAPAKPCSLESIERDVEEHSSPYSYCEHSPCGTNDTATPTMGGRDEIPPLLSSSSSHSMESDDEDIEASPLAIMMRARDGRPFTNPYHVFEKVFGTSLFSEPEEEPSGGRHRRSPSTPRKKQQRQSRSSAWKGESKVLMDGTFVSTTTRVLHNKRLVRTETITTDENGEKHSRVTITSEELEIEPPPDAAKSSPSYEDYEAKPCDGLQYLLCSCGLFT